MSREYGDGVARCAATRADGSPCRAESLDGSQFCWHHGTGTGTALNNKGVAGPNQNQSQEAINRTAIDMTRAKMLYGAPRPSVTGEEALTDELARTVGHVEWLQEQVATSDPIQFAESLWLFKLGAGFVSDEQIDYRSWNAAAAIWLDLYLKERAHLVRVAETALRTRLNERQFEIAQQQATVFSGVQRAILTRMLDTVIAGLRTAGVDDSHIRAITRDWTTAVAVVVPEEMRAVTARVVMSDSELLEVAGL